MPEAFSSPKAGRGTSAGGVGMCVILPSRGKSEESVQVEAGSCTAAVSPLLPQLECFCSAVMDDVLKMERQAVMVGRQVGREWSEEAEGVGKGQVRKGVKEGIGRQACSLCLGRACHPILLPLPENVRPPLLPAKPARQKV